MQLAGLRHLLFWIFAALIFGACSSSPAPAPPPPSTSSSAELNGYRGGGDDDDDFDDDFEDDGEDEEKDDEEEDGEDTDWDDCGADIADQETKDEVQECIDKGRFFDRFAGDSGKCTRRKLAKVNCNEEAILAIMSKKNQKQFEDALEGSYEGFEIDQIADCPPGTTSSVCRENGDGDVQVGTKIFFVKEEESELLGKAMLLKTRPGQDDSEEAEDEEEED